LNQMCIYLPIKPISVNESQIPVRGRIACSYKTNKFKKNMNFMLLSHVDELNSFARRVKSEMSYFECRYIFWLPKKELITKRGTVSKISMDLDNCLKYMQDVMFNALGMKNKLINDAMIVKYTSIDKRISPRNEFGVTIHIMHRVFDKTA